MKRSWISRVKEKGSKIRQSITDNKELVAIIAVGAVVTGAVITTKPEDKPYETELREIDAKLRYILEHEPEWTGGEDELYAGEEYGYRP